MKKDRKSFARSLRRNQTEAENVLWKQLRARQFSGFKFRRQQSLGPYVADFCSFEGKLIVELDGGQHIENRLKDDRRTEFLNRKGFKVIRFWDNEAFANLEAVLEQIRKNLIESPHPGPLPQGAREKGKQKPPK